MAILSPSILAADVLALGNDVKVATDAGAKWLHVDVMDGSFVPNLSFGYSVVGALRKITDAVLDVHLMIDKPIRYVDNFCRAGADYLTVHIEADTKENIAKTLDEITARGVKAGLSVKPKTAAEEIKPYIEKCSLILVMTVEPGFGGQSFMADMMPKLREIRKLIDEINPDCRLEVDGGIDLTTAATVKENGADTLVAGSAFYKAADKRAFVEEIEK